MDTDLLAKILKALSDPTRLKILKLLPTSAAVCDDLYNVSELSTELMVPQPTISHHLNVLKNAGIIKGEKMCRDVYYWIDMNLYREAIKELSSNMDKGDKSI